MVINVLRGMCLFAGVLYLIRVIQGWPTDFPEAVMVSMVWISLALAWLVFRREAIERKQEKQRQKKKEDGT